MGCQSSTSTHNDILNEPRRKRNMKSGYEESHRKKLLDAIEWNDASDFAVASEENDIAINAQLSQKGLYWMATHYCCRWNAYKVLDYVLKAAYLDGPINYPKYINQQTIEGYSALHLCVIWNSPQCLEVLLKYGGLNLGTKDNTQMTPYMATINYKRNQMKSTFQKYEDLGIIFLNVEHQKLSNGDILTFDTKDFSERNGIFNQKQILLIKNLLAPTEKQKQLEAERIKLQIQKENIRLQLKKIEQEQAKKESQKRKKQSQQQQFKKKIKNQRDIQQKEKNLIQEMQIKEKQLKKLKEDLNKIFQEKQQTIIKDQIKKSEEFLLKNETQLQSKLQLKKSIIEQQKQSVIKIREERCCRGETNRAIVKDEIEGQLPEELKQTYEKAKNDRNYIDSDFPHSQKSIGNTPKAKKFISELIWLRPYQIFKGDYKLFDGIDPNDIKQGSLGVCYMLATLSTLAQFPQRIKQIFVFYDKVLGFYVLKILIHGEVKFVVVDDAIPCSKSTKSPLFAKPNGNELWVCLVEKAWAKCIGNYMKAQSMTPNHLMQDLTMCPSFGVWFKDKTDKTFDIDLHTKMGNIVVLTSVADKKIEGIVNNHAYSLLSVYSHEGKNIYKIRNPWGKFEWKGQYHDSSPLWTQQLKKKVNLVDQDDGIFFLSESELLEAFVYYSISITRIKNKYSYVSVKMQKDESKYFTFELREDQEINLRVVQKFNRMLDDPEYKYSPVIFQVGKIEENGEVTYLTEGDNTCFWGAKSVHADPQLIKLYKKGKYFVRLAVQWLDDTKYNTCVFAVFANHEVKITQLSLQEGNFPSNLGTKYWVELLKSFALKKSTPTVKQNMEYIMVWMKAQMVCYSCVKQTQKCDKFEAKWTFNPGKFNNCAFGLNNIKGTNDLKYPIEKGKKGGNVGTLRRLLINQSCSSGQVYISATPLTS